MGDLVRTLPCGDADVAGGQDDLGEQVVFLEVDTKDASAAAGPSLEEVGVRYPQVVAPAAALLRATQVPGLPVTLFLAADGGVVDQHIGRLDREELDEMVARIMNDDAVSRQ